MTKRDKEKEGLEAKQQSESTADALPFVCVHCGVPCACLYRQLNKKSLSSIKAMHCKNCNRIVDPYIEREWLLVLLDCILLRPEAYRHVLYNNQDVSWYVHSTHHTDSDDNEKTENGAVGLIGSRIANLIQWTLVSSLFHAFLKWKALLHAQQEKQRIRYGVSMPLELVSINPESPMLLRVIFVATSFLDIIAQWLAVYGFVKLISKESTKSSHSIGNQIYLALLLPTSFQVVCVLVLLWEDSKTATALGSLLIACWQFLGIALVSIQSSKQQNIVKLCAPLVGMVVLLAWRFWMDRFLTNVVGKDVHGTIPCVGFEMDVFEVIGFVSNRDVCRAFEWIPSPLLLCLT